jgi:hypothetical protein
LLNKQRDNPNFWIVNWIDWADVRLSIRAYLNRVSLVSFMSVW